MIVLSSSEQWAPSSFHSAEGRKADILVQDFDLGEADLAQQVQLEEQRAGRVLLLDVGEHMVPVGFVLQPGQVLAVAPAHEFLDHRDRTLDQIEYPYRSARPECPVKRREDLPPLLVGTQVVKNRS